MSKKTKTVYNLEDETVVIKIDAKTKDCVCKHEENSEMLKRTPKHQVYHQTTNNKAFKLPFQPDKPQFYPVAVTIEKIEKQRRSSLRADSNKSAPSKQSEFLEDDEEFSYSTGKEYDQGSRNSSNGSKSTKSSSSDEKERISVVSEETRSLEDDEQNIVTAPLKNQDKTEILSVSNIEIAHYPFKNSERSPSLLPPPSRNSKDSDRLPFLTENQPILMNASVTNEDGISASNSESTISVFDINNASLPLQPRDHGNHCAIEVSVLEKHKDGCTNTRREIAGRNIEDKVGSYDVVSRIVYRTCGPDKKVIATHIKNSLKSYHLNNPKFFGKNLQETRSRVETIPILPNYKCVLNADFPRTEKTFGEISGKRTSIESKAEPHVTENLTTLNSPPEVLSVYIRTDRSEKVPDGFEKMHFRGDSCKLHDPEERTKQILQLQKVIEETSSEAYLSKSPRQFGGVDNPQIMPATAVAHNPNPLQAMTTPQIVLASDSEEETDDSTVSVHQENREKNKNYDDESLDELPTNDDNKKESDEIVSAGFFNCFRRNKQKRQREVSIEFVRDFSGKRVTHSVNQPRRNTEEDVGTHHRKLSAQYKR